MSKTLHQEMQEHQIKYWMFFFPFVTREFEFCKFEANASDYLQVGYFPCRCY